MLYDTLQTNIKKENITEQTQTVNIWVIENAELPTFPSKPNKKRTLMLAMLLGLFGGVGLAFLIEYLDNTVKSEAELEKRFSKTVLGSVEKIGLKTTRLRSLSGEQLVFSNTDLLNSRVRNFGRMFERRVVFMLGVTYQTPRDKLRLIPRIIREAVEAQQNTRFDRSHFNQYGDFSLNFESVYYVLSRDYNQYMDIQQSIYLAIHEGFEAEGIEFAYPTQTLFLEHPGGVKTASADE